MKIGIISDTHGDRDALEKAAIQAKNIDFWLHCGDLVEDGEYLAFLSEKRVYQVVGNCDWSTGKYPEEKIIAAGECKIFFTHGHKYGIKSSLYAIKKEAKELGADIIIFGHSHRNIILEEDNFLILNPGSPAYPRGGDRKTFMILEILAGKKVSAELCYIK